MEWEHTGIETQLFSTLKEICVIRKKHEITLKLSLNENLCQRILFSCLSLINKGQIFPIYETGAQRQCSV